MDKIIVRGKNKPYSGIGQLPTGRADDSITEGCLVLEGGGWKGLYTIGVVDALMTNNLNFRTTVGISAGALTGVGYVAGQIGWAIHIDLTYRHDPRYCGFGALRAEHGIMGYKYLFREINREFPLDKKRLKTTERRLIVGATNMLTGELTYFDKDCCNILAAAAASASVPFVSRPIMIGGVPYLDGGCVDKIPYRWAVEHGEKKIIIVKTRERGYRRKEGKNRVTRLLYHEYPEFAQNLATTNARFNLMADEIDQEEREGNVFVIAPSRPVDVSRFDGNLEKLGALYWLGYQDAMDSLVALKEYLAADES